MSHNRIEEGATQTSGMMQHDVIRHFLLSAQAVCPCIHEHLLDRFARRLDVKHLSKKKVLKPVKCRNLKARNELIQKLLQQTNH